MGLPNGFTIYTGPSEIDGSLVKGTFTGTNVASKNKKTDDMMQLFIMPVSSKPSDAVQNGDDAAVCGACVHRPLLVKAAKAAAKTETEKAAVPKPCYVEVGKSVNKVYAATYPEHGESKRKPPVRFGAWGEPTAIPFDVIAGYTSDGHTGYTHRWKAKDGVPACDPRFKLYLMASVDSAAEYAEATATGWRCFRVRKPWEPILDGEIMCPASDEAGKRTTCNRCLLCAGTSKKAKDITIIEHN
jgi:hypothetical protein